MTPSRAITLLAGAAAVPLVALVVAGCGSGGSSASPARPENKKVGPPTVEVSTIRLGAVLVDSRGRTLYLFKKDQGTKSTCFGSCASAWPPLRTKGKPKAGGDAKESLIGTTKRPDGPPQVSYNGHPLYLYQGDLKPGDATGQGVDVWGGLWWAVSPTGKQVTKGGRKPAGGGY
jgi:predicted lipoprotein with Yx(FWY)xxD motif